MTIFYGKNSFEEIAIRHNFFKDYPPTAIQKEVCDYFALFTQEEKHLLTALAHNPFDKNHHIEMTAVNLGNSIGNSLRILNQLHNCDESILEFFDQWKMAILLFLIDFKFAFKYSGKNVEAEKMLKKDKMKYAMELLKHIDISEIRDELEDKFFASLEPEIFNRYAAKIQLSLNDYHECALDAKNKLNKIFQEEKINAEIYSRFKTVYSVHKKIIKKNILPSQVFDIMGLRIIVNNVEDCYKVMEQILKNWPVFKNKVKDYIAVPKTNGYESIHLVVSCNDSPVEIQIRTKAMHQAAQYGAASHVNYKLG